MNQPPPADPSVEEREGPDVRDFLDMLYRHRWASVLVLVAVVSAGALYSFRRTPVYASTPALLEITGKGAGIATVRDVFERELLTSQNFETLVQVLKSEGMLRAAWEDCPSARGRMPFEEFAEAFSVAPVRNSFLVRISFESPWPEVNPPAANALARAFIRITREQREARTSRAGDQLVVRREELRVRLEEAEKGLAAFRTASQRADVRSEKAGLDRAVAEFESRFDQQQLELVALDREKAEVDAARKAGNLMQVGDVLKDPAFQEIERAIRNTTAERYDVLKDFTEGSPKLKPIEEQLADLRARREEIVNAIVAKIETNWETARKAVEKIGELRDARRLERQELARLVIEQTNLEAARDRIRTDLDDLAKQASEVTGAEGFDLSPAILHEEARATDVPVRPRPLRDMALAGFLAVLLAVGASYLLEQFNDAALRPDEVARTTGLAVLGMLPRLSVSRDRPDVASLEDPKGEMAEAVRIIRTSILFTPTGTATRRRILVTSAEPGEGKTLLCANLAAALAQAGQRTLLVDSDLRRPRLHRVFAIDNEDGLTGIFRNGSVRPRSHRVPSEERLDVVPSGPIPPNPAELLVGERMGEFLADASGSYDRIVLDSPPAGPVSDPSLLARQVDGVLLVVQLGRTSLRSIRRACDHLQKVGAPMLGLVLNGVSLGGGYYHYYRHYGYRYGRAEGDGGRGNGSRKED